MNVCLHIIYSVISGVYTAGVCDCSGLYLIPLSPAPNVTMTGE
jgi:hypothetical protein